MVAPNIEFFHIDKMIPGATSSALPDVTGYALRDYGSRIGVFRMMEVLDKHSLRASVLLNADVCAHHPAIIEEGNRRNWEWLGHGVTNNTRMNQYPADEERGVIRQIRDTIASATGKAPRGWLGPGGGDESPHTLDHLAAEGFDYVCDWGFDDQPLRHAGAVGPHDRDSLPARSKRHPGDFSGRPHAEGLVTNGLRSVRYALRSKVSARRG